MELTTATTALITGASSGIGAALARKLGSKGANVAICARREDRLAAVAQEVVDAGGKALAIRADVAVRDEAENTVRRTIEQFGRIDLLVNNAGRGNLAAVEDTTQEQLESMFAVNAFALWYTTGAALPTMKRQGRGCIVNIASVAGKMAYPYNSAYVAAKHACVGFTAALRAELVETGVEAIVICPAGVETEWADITEGGPISELFAKGIAQSRTIAAERDLPLAPLQRMKPANEIADIILDAVERPAASDVFTHSGTYELALQAAEDRPALELRNLPLYLGMRNTYAKMKQSEG